MGRRDANPYVAFSLWPLAFMRGTGWSFRRRWGVRGASSMLMDLEAQGNVKLLVLLVVVHAVGAVEVADVVLSHGDVGHQTVGVGLSEELVVTLLGELRVVHAHGTVLERAERDCGAGSLAVQEVVGGACGDGDAGVSDESTAGLGVVGRVPHDALGDEESKLRVGVEPQELECGHGRVDVVVERAVVVLDERLELAGAYIAALNGARHVVVLAEPVDRGVGHHLHHGRRHGLDVLDLLRLRLGDLDGLNEGLRGGLVVRHHSLVLSGERLAGGDHELILRGGLDLDFLGLGLGRRGRGLGGDELRGAADHVATGRRRHEELGGGALGGGGLELDILLGRGHELLSRRPEVLGGSHVLLGRRLDGSVVLSRLLGDGDALHGLRGRGGAGRDGDLLRGAVEVDLALGGSGTAGGAHEFAEGLEVLGEDDEGAVGGLGDRGRRGLNRLLDSGRGGGRDNAGTGHACGLSGGGIAVHGGALKVEGESLTLVVAVGRGGLGGVRMAVASALAVGRLVASSGEAGLNRVFELYSGVRGEFERDDVVLILGEGARQKGTADASAGGAKSSRKE